MSVCVCVSAFKVHVYEHGVCVWVHREQKETREGSRSGQTKQDIVGSEKTPERTMGFILEAVVCYHKPSSKVGEVTD